MEGISDDGVFDAVGRRTCVSRHAGAWHESVRSQRNASANVVAIPLVDGFAREV
jgi:hypothetical protein